jgi:hypothetical protein
VIGELRAAFDGGAFEITHRVLVVHSGRIAGHVSLSFPPSKPLSVSGQTSDTGDPTVPLADAV